MGQIVTATDVAMVTATAPVLAKPDRADQNPARVYLARLAPGSRRAQAGALEVIARLLSADQVGAEALPWAELRYQHTQAARTALAGRYAPATANRMLAALRGVLREAWRLGLLGAEELARATDLATVHGFRLPAGREVTPGELSTLFSLCAEDRNPTCGARDAAALALLYGAGLRRSEAVSRELTDFDRETGALTVCGKGRKERTAYLDAGAREAIAVWLEYRGSERGPLLTPITRSGNVLIRPLTAQAVRKALRRRSDAAGLREFTPHDLRRSFISHLLDRGADIATVQRMAGHAQVTTTARYDRRGEEAKQKASALLAVPFRRPERRP